MSPCRRKTRLVTSATPRESSQEKMKPLLGLYQRPSRTGNTHTHTTAFGFVSNEVVGLQTLQRSSSGFLPDSDPVLTSDLLCVLSKDILEKNNGQKYGEHVVPRPSLTFLRPNDRGQAEDGQSCSGQQRFPPRSTSSHPAADRQPCFSLLQAVWLHGLLTCSLQRSHESTCLFYYIYDSTLGSVPKDGSSL